MRKAKRRVRSSHPGVKLKLRQRENVETWYARWVDPETGKSIDTNITALGKTSAEARREWAIQKSQAISRSRADVAAGIERPVAVPIASAVTAYTDSVKSRLRPRTWEQYTASANQFAEWLRTVGVATADKITTKTLTEYRDHLLTTPRQNQVAGGRRGQRSASAKRRSPASVNHDLRQTKAMLNDWRVRGYVPKLGRDGISDGLKTVTADRSRPSFLAPESIRKLLEACIRHDTTTFAMTREEKDAGGESDATRRGRTQRYDAIGPFVVFLLLSGCRVGEVQELRWDDVNLEALDEHGQAVGEIVVRPTATKTRMERAIDLGVSPALRALLVSLKLQRQRGDAFVFGRSEPLRRFDVENARRRLHAQFGCPKFDWQTLRATTATFLVNAPGVFGSAAPFREAAQLGHSVTVAQKHYYGLVRGIARDAHTIESSMQADDLIQRIVANITARHHVAAAS